MLREKSDILTVQRAQYVNWCNNRNFLSSPLVMATNTTVETEKTNARSLILPPELLMEIFSYLDNNQIALHSVSLVCKQWFYCAVPILYCHPQINDTYRWATFILTLTRERMSFFYGDLIRSIDLSSGKSIEAMKDQEFYRRLSDVNDNHQQPQQPQQPQPLQQPTIGEQVSVMSARNRFYISSTRNFRNSESDRRREEYEYVVKGLPFIIVSTSSLLQVASTCKNLTTLNLSYTSMLHDSVIAETGEYLSTLQRYAVQPGLTQIKIPIEDAIEAIGNSCTQLQEVKIQRCEWVTAHVIWLFAHYCPNLKRLDARRSTKCTVKKLIAGVLELPGFISSSSNYRGSSQANLSSLSAPPFAANTSLPIPRPSHRGPDALEGAFVEEEDEEEEEDDDEEEEVAFIEEPRNAGDGTQVGNAGGQDGDVPMLHFRFNDETGLWEREGNVQLTNTEMTVIEDNAEAVRNGTFWFVPLPNIGLEDEAHPLGRRPPSPFQNQLASQSATLAEDKSLRDIIRTIIIECKDLGGLDLNWIQDFQ